MSFLRLLLPLTLVLCGVADDEIVKEFKKYFRKYKDAPTRVEAVLALEGTESTEVVDVLVPILKDKQPEVARASVRVLASFESRPPIDRLLEQLESQSDARVRAGLLQAIAEGGYSGTSEALIALLEDGSWDVRRRAVQALVATHEPAADEFIAPLSYDPEIGVRCAVMDGLAQLGSRLVLAPAVSALDDESWQIRTSAIHALSQVRDRDSIEPLLNRMSAEEGRLVEDIGQALANLTGRDFGQRIDAWQNFWNAYKDRFQIPTDAELALLREKQKERREIYSPPGAVSFHGVETPSRSIIFVIDVSGSMEQEVVDVERFEAGGYPSMKRIDIVKTELIRTIEGLEPYVRFNILAFATEVDPWKKSLVAANPLNRSSAESFVRKLEAIGGSSKQDLARAGLVGAANLEAGKTNSYDALMSGLGVDEKKGATDDYEVDVDTIFFLSDGRPSFGKFIDTADILREVNEANELRRIVIHTIALGEFQKDFMRRLAQENGGVFIDLGK